MPMRKGRSKGVVSRNIREFHHGATYRKTARKYGKARANRQAVAAAMRTAGKSRSRRKR